MTKRIGVLTLAMTLLSIPAARAQDAEAPLPATVTIEQVRRAIDRLPEHFRAALVLCEYEQMDYAQIADVLGASIPQVKTWLHRGRRQLATMLQPLHDEGVKDASTAAARRAAER